MPNADLVLYNARILTMNPSQSTGQLVAVSGNRILFVGDNGDLPAFSGQNTKTIDCNGNTLVPGFHDAHCHLFSFIRKLLSIDLSPQSVRSIADIRDRIHEKAQTLPPGTWISGTNYNEFYLAEKRHPTRRDIDKAAPNHPVVLSHRSLHACVLNSLALELAGITIASEEPEGACIDREPDTGEPSGLLLEMLGYIRNRVMPHITEDDIQEGIRLAGKHYVSQGITSIQEATVSNNHERWQQYRRGIDNGLFPVRLILMPGMKALAQFHEAGIGYRDGDDHLRLGHVKFILNATTGKLFPSPEEFTANVLTAQQAGFPSAVHAVEEIAVEASVQAFEKARVTDSHHRFRHRIEHCAECPPHLLARMRVTRPVVATQPPFLYYSGERYLRQVPEQQQQWLYLFKSLVDAGLVVAGSSDSPVVPCNPLSGIYGAVARRAESDEQLLPAECLSPYQALQLYTINAAFSSGDEQNRGTLQEGKLADMALLSGNPLEVETEELKEITVLMTILDGKIVYQTG